MAIVVTGTNGPNLLARIKAAIDSGTVRTWRYDKDGDFVHSVSQWDGKAWLRPRLVNDGIIFNILAPKNTRISKEVYAIYHARFIEMLLAHFDTVIGHAIATALPVKPDIVG